MSTHDRAAVQTTNSSRSDYGGEEVRKVVDGTKQCPVWVESVDYRGAKSNLRLMGWIPFSCALVPLSSLTLTSQRSVFLFRKWAHCEFRVV